MASNLSYPNVSVPLPSYWVFANRNVCGITVSPKFASQYPGLSSSKSHVLLCTVAVLFGHMIELGSFFPGLVAVFPPLTDCLELEKV